MKGDFQELNKTTSIKNDLEIIRNEYEYEQIVYVLVEKSIDVRVENVYTLHFFH